MMEPSTSKINLTFPFVVFGIYSKLRGVYLEMSVSVFNVTSFVAIQNGYVS